MEAEDSNGNILRLDDHGVTYGDQFVAFEDMGGVQSMPHQMVGESLYDVTVIRKNGPPDLVIPNLPEDMATTLSRSVGQILRERYG